MDCSGIGQLVELFVKVRRLGGRFALVNVRRRQRHLLDIAGLLPLFPVYECTHTELSRCKTMALPSADQSLLRRYLLGTVTPESREDLEARLFSDDRIFSERLSIAEDELVSDYVQSALTDAERQDFEKHFLCTDERRAKLEFARALHAYADAARSASDDIARIALGLAAAADVVSGLGGRGCRAALPGRSGTSIRIQLGRRHTSNVVAISLTSGRTRASGGELTRVRLNADSQIVVRLQLDPESTPFRHLSRLAVSGRRRCPPRGNQADAHAVRHHPDAAGRVAGRGGLLRQTARRLTRNRSCAAATLRLPGRPRLRRLLMRPIVTFRYSKPTPVTSRPSGPRRFGHDRIRDPKSLPNVGRPREGSRVRTASSTNLAGVEEALRQHGVRTYSIFLDAETNHLFGYVEVE